MTKKWGEIQRKWDLVRVSGEFKLSGFFCSWSRDQLSVKTKTVTFTKMIFAELKEHIKITNPSEYDEIKKNLVESFLKPLWGSNFPCL